MVATFKFSVARTEYFCDLFSKWWYHVMTLFLFQNTMWVVRLLIADKAVKKSLLGQMEKVFSVLLLGSPIVVIVLLTLHRRVYSTKVYSLGLIN